MITLLDSSTIFILAPANSASGGQEALHQLGYYLNKGGYTAKMAYYLYDASNSSPTAEKYEKYSVPFCLYDEIVDESQNVLICPEIATSFLQDFQNMQKTIWWLSVYFYRAGFRHSSLLKMIPNLLRGRISKIKEIRAGRKRMFNFDQDNVTHFTASEYAFTYVKSRGGNPQRLIEPLGMDFLLNFSKHDDFELNAANREKRVLYNPIKASSMMNVLQKKFPHIPFEPLQGYTPEGLIEIMKTSRLYVDFGKFPGPERLPKEAAICGCCIITGTRGASAFYEDVRISDEYKMKNESPKDVAGFIEEVLENYDQHISSFEEYRSMVKELEERFITQIKELFISG